MIRKSTINISEANTTKKRTLDLIFKESVKVVNAYIDLLWGRSNQTFVSDKVHTWLSARTQQCLGKQALAIIKSQRKKRNKTKPIFKANVIELDQRFVKITQDVNSFDIWFRLASIGNKIRLNLPGKKHKHFNIFNNWKLLKSVRLRKVAKRYFIDCFFETEPIYKSEGRAVGLDCGYNVLVATSDGNYYGKDLKVKIDKISRKTQGSKAFKCALIERDNYVNHTIKSINLSDIKTVVIEDLKNVKHKSKLSHKTMNKVQRWTYAKFKTRLKNYCEVSGVHIHEVNPAYTSQTCSKCGYQDKLSRNGEIFKCTSCNYTAHADYNASLNILQKFLVQALIVPVKN